MVRSLTREVLGYARYDEKKGHFKELKALYEESAALEQRYCDWLREGMNSV